MMETMRRLALTILVSAGAGAMAAGATGASAAGAAPVQTGCPAGVDCRPSLPAAAPARAGCIPTWSKSDYKSYGQVQADVHNQFGDVRILKVALCVYGAKSYFQIVIMDSKGVVRTLHIGARP